MSIVDHSVSRAFTATNTQSKGLRLELEFVDVERDGMSDQLFAAPFDDETVLLDRDDVFGPLVHERHVEPRMGKHATNISANRAGPDDSDSHRRPALVVIHVVRFLPDRDAARSFAPRRPRYPSSMSTSGCRLSGLGLKPTPSSCTISTMRSLKGVEIPASLPLRET